MPKDSQNACFIPKLSLTVAVPSGRDMSYIARIISNLSWDASTAQVKFVVGRWCQQPFSDSELTSLSTTFPIEQVLCDQSHSMALRNEIIHQATTGHILFMDDDMVPSSDLIQAALALIQKEPGTVYQGPPYLVANPKSWLARMEGRLYERGYNRYVASNGTVEMLDARLLLAPVSVLLTTPFDASLYGGEGRDLAERLLAKGVTLLLAPELVGAHINRDSLGALVTQKRLHGNGRGQRYLRMSCRHEMVSTMKADLARHMLSPLKDMFTRRKRFAEVIYILGTNAAFWYGIMEVVIKNKRER